MADRGLAGMVISRHGRPVPPGNSIVSLTCLFACEAGVVMVGWPGAAQDRLSADALVIQPG